MGNARNLADLLGTSTKANQVISTSGAITTTGAFTSPGIDDNGDATTITLDANEDITAANGMYVSGDLTSLTIDKGGIDRSGNTTRIISGRSGGNYADFSINIAGTGNAVHRQVYVDYQGNMTLDNGNLTIGTAGKGIDFSVNTASSVTGTSNQDELLDHYEEGYFTPTIYGSGGSAGNQQINGQEGRYVKIGKLVYITLYFYLANGGAGSWSGTNRFGGLPFTNGISNRQALSIGSDGLNSDEIAFTVTGSGNYGHVVDMYTGAAVNYSSFITGYSIQMSGCYYTT